MKKSRKRSHASFLWILWSIGSVVAFLYFGRPLLVPLSLAVLFTFILTPVVQTVQRSGLRRVSSVMLVVFVSIVVAALIGWGVGTQLNKLSRDLPEHTEQMRAKIGNLRQAESERLSRLFRLYHDVGTPSPEQNTASIAVAPPIVVQSASPAVIDNLSTIAGLILEPIATALLVMILVCFMLIRREDLRNRVIGLLGHGRLTGTTRVTVEAAERLSRFLLAQISLNAIFGLVFALALWAIGVPYWLLWGFLIAVLRFVPYVGAWAAAVGPILLSFAIFPGWIHPLFVLGVFVTMELVTANVVEPVVFGHRTGVSPVALLVAAAFWTWVWGPIGLVLSTPLTVCLVVLGQHVPRFRFMATLLDDQPALKPYVRYYQRLLAGDRNEAAQLIAEYSQDRDKIEVFDGVLLPSLLRTRRDRKQSGLTSVDETFIFDATRQVLEQVAQKASPRSGKSDIANRLGAQERPIVGLHFSKNSNIASPGLGITPSEIAEAKTAIALPLVFTCPAHHQAEELSLAMLGQAVESLGCRFEIASTRTLPVEIEARLAAERPALVFIAVLPPGGLIQARYLCRRIRKSFPDLKIVVGYWGRVRNFDRLLVRLRSSGANYVTTSISQSRAQIAALLSESSSFPADEAKHDVASMKRERANV
jgi:predicted PurR-regulated permease PerM